MMKKSLYNIITKIHIIIGIILFISPSYNVNADTINYEDTFNILVINSYNAESYWERLIFDGLKEKLAPYPDATLSVEYLDSRDRSDEAYSQSFLNLLNVKYRDKNIDAILTVDDEAFDFVRSNIFNTQSLMYKVPTIFLGANKEIVLTPEESNYITGIIEIEDNLKFLNMLLDIHSDLKTVNVLLDTATFSNIVKENIEYVQYFTKRPLNINFIQGTYIDELTTELEKVNTSNSVCFLIGDFKDRATDYDLKIDDTINIFESITNRPIYTKVEPYLYAGAIGGTVDLGKHHGNYAGEILIRLINGEHIKNIKPIYNTLDVTIFNYQVMQRYNINPLLLPEDIIFINRGPLDFLLPKSIKFIIFSAIIIFISLIIYFIFEYYKNKRKAVLNEILLNQAIESEKLKTDFITTVSHELRTPLNIILNTSKLLEIKVENNDIDINYIANKLSYINQSSVRLLRLINNIIDISKLESGFIEPHFENMNIVEVVEETVLSVVDFANSSSIELIFDTEEEEIITAIDKAKIERVMLNLLSNAIKFTPANGAINVTIKNLGANVIIEVKDSGIGIAESQLKYIFDRFHQVDSSLTRANEGSGLGLFIVKGLISIHNGTITVDSIENGGTTFIISLPIKTIKADTLNHNIGDIDLEQLVKLEMSDLKDKD